MKDSSRALRERADFPLIVDLLEVYRNWRQSGNELKVGLDRPVVESLRADDAEPDERFRIFEEFCKRAGTLDVRLIPARLFWRERVQKICDVMILERPEERLKSILGRVVSDQPSLSPANIVGRQSGGISATSGDLKQE